tara:strand:- start:292 stop:474 length:183 start_codon:yes stop_codon:yes gene_type:complete
MPHKMQMCFSNNTVPSVKRSQPSSHVVQMGGKLFSRNGAKNYMNVTGLKKSKGCGACGGR